MRLRPLATLSIAALSLGFVGHSPTSPQERRHVSSCTDTTATPGLPLTSLAPFPTDLFSAVQNDGVREAANAYALFVRQLQINASVSAQFNPFSPPSYFGFPQLAFPSYALPSIDKYPIDLRKPDPSTLAWSGLESNPTLQYLVAPPTSPAQKSGVPATVANASLNGLVDLNPLPTAGTPMAPPSGINSARF
jgi:hypothetical protein